MNAKIHDILEEAGVAKGISAGEVLVLMILNSPSALHNFEKILEDKVALGVITDHEKHAAMLRLENAAEENIAAQNRYLDTIDEKFEEIFLQYFQEELKTKKAKLDDIEAELTAIFS